MAFYSASRATSIEPETYPLLLQATANYFYNKNVCRWLEDEFWSRVTWSVSDRETKGTTTCRFYASSIAAADTFVGHMVPIHDRTVKRRRPIDATHAILRYPCILGIAKRFQKVEQRAVKRFVIQRAFSRYRLAPRTYSLQLCPAHPRTTVTVAPEQADMTSDRLALLCLHQDSTHTVSLSNYLHQQTLLATEADVIAMRLQEMLRAIDIVGVHNDLTPHNIQVRLPATLAKSRLAVFEAPHPLICSFFLSSTLRPEIFKQELKSVDLKQVCSKTAWDDPLFEKSPFVFDTPFVSEKAHNTVDWITLLQWLHMDKHIDIYERLLRHFETWIRELTPAPDNLEAILAAFAASDSIAIERLLDSM